MSESLHHQAEIDFGRARSKAFLREILSLFSRKRNELLSFDEVRHRLKLRCGVDRGIQTVVIDKIVGSVDRYKDFDREFLPLQSHTKGKWKSIDTAYYRDVFLPPVKLYKVGDAYFVQDGHHRISVGKEKGVEFIDAEVIECPVNVPVTADLQPRDLDIKEEYVDFLRRTKLDQIRPEQRIEFSAPWGYNTLWEHIGVHRYYLGEKRGEGVPLEEAVASWYDNLYMPIVRIIREQNILKEFPGRTEADLYLWIIDHRHYLTERYGQGVDFGEAAADFAQRYSQRPLKKTIRKVKEAVEDIADEMTPEESEDWPLAQL